MRKPLPGHLLFREAVKNKTNKNEKKKNSNLSITVFNAADRNRTGTGITTHGILSPGRLPTWQQFDWLMSGLEIEQPKAFKTP